MTKNRVIQIRLTEAQYVVISLAAHRDNRTISDYVRSRLLDGGWGTPTDPPTDSAPKPEPPATTEHVLPPEAQALLKRHAQTGREVRPYPKAEQAGRKPKP